MATDGKYDGGVNDDCMIMMAIFLQITPDLNVQ